jgi:gamma-glutamyl-gamma-aminobutyrate hydrolase PuuD
MSLTTCGVTHWRWHWSRSASLAAVPLLGICRGFQEMNVAFGGSLHPEIRELPGRVNHRMPRLETGEIHPDHDVVFGDRHDVRLTPGGAFARLLGQETIRVNSLHGQGILEPGERIVVEGVAGRRHHRSDSDCRCSRLCTRRAMARGI